MERLKIKITTQEEQQGDREEVARYLSKTSSSLVRPPCFILNSPCRLSIQTVSRGFGELQEHGAADQAPQRLRQVPQQSHEPETAGLHGPAEASCCCSSSSSCAITCGRTTLIKIMLSLLFAVSLGSSQPVVNTTLTTRLPREVTLGACSLTTRMKPSPSQ